MQPPKGFLGEIIWNGASSIPMRNPPQPDSNEAVSERLRLLRLVKSEGASQTAFAATLKIETKRWNNLERGYPLSKEIAFTIVRRFPDVTTDWLWFGREDGLPVKLQRELAEAGKASTPPAGRSRSRTG